MKLNNSELKNYVCGAYTVKFDNGFIAFSRFDEKQFEVTEKLNPVIRTASRVNASVTIEFVTDAKSVEFDCVISDMATEYDSIDVFCDGALIRSFDLDGIVKGVTSHLFAQLPIGKKHLTVYMPSDGDAKIANFALAGATYADKPIKSSRVMFIGDSITQGYGPYMTGYTYVNIFGRLAGCEVFNQGIGGYYYDEKFVVPLDTPAPDKIIVAMGTNQIHSADKADRVREFYNRLVPLYKKAEIVAVTPIFRCDPNADLDKLAELAESVKATCGGYGIRVIDGMTLVPHSAKWFKDGLHPNASGCMLYAHRLYDALKN